MTPAHSEHSPLENLPTELREQIFLQCLNFNLPLASSHLGSALSSTSTKMAVVMKIFPSDDATKFECNAEMFEIFELEQDAELSHIWPYLLRITEPEPKILECS